MTTLATIPALFAVALSISTTNDYHYVTIPTNMAASLTGVGMGSEASSEDAPLRYEDAAFLAEAYAERARFAYGSTNLTWGSASSEEIAIYVANPGSGSLYYDSYPSPIAEVSEREKATYVGRAYADPSIPLLDGGCTSIVITASMGRFPAWPYIFTSTNDEQTLSHEQTLSNEFPFVVSTCSFTNSIPKGTPLATIHVRSLYRDLPNLSRFCWSDVGEVGSNVHTSQTVNDYSGYSTKYNSTTDEWEFGFPKSTVSEVSTNRISTFRWCIRILAQRAKARGFASVEGSKYPKDVTGVFESSGYRTEKIADISDMVMPISRVSSNYNSLHTGTRIRDVKVFAQGHLSWVYRLNDAIADSGGGDFIVEVPVEIAPSWTQLVILGMGSEQANKMLYDKARKIFDCPGYSSVDEVMESMPELGDPSEDWQSYSPVKCDVDYTEEVSISQFYTIFDVDFNARTSE